MKNNTSPASTKIQHVAFRTDAGLHIGTGHVMRCLTLANTLAASGVQCSFVCRNHEGQLASTILAQGHHCYLLPHPTQTIHHSPDIHAIPPHSAWLGESWQNDLAQTESVLANLDIDWLIVDHYALDARWETSIRHRAKNIMVIDDLADRQHDCDLLLDQTLKRQSLDYQTKVPAHCILLCGIQYALLRPEFSAWRSYSLQHRPQSSLKQLLINMGGVDHLNYTGQILEALTQCYLPSELSITVVMGITAPHLNAISLQAKQMPVTTIIKTNVSNMAEIMANSDLAIGAAGATSWERCCLGLPTLMLVLADNQKTTASALEQSGAVLMINTPQDITPIFQHMLQTPSDLQTMSAAASQLTDGTGINDVLAQMRIVRE